MRLEDIEWDLIQWSLLVTIICAALTLTAVSYSGDMLNDAENEYRRSRSKLNEVARDFRASQDDRVLYQQYVQRFADLQARGVIGEEQRLAWIELLKEINGDLKLPVLRYDIRPRHALPIDDRRAQRDKLAAYETTMHLTLGVLHEGDLFVVEQALRERAQGLFETRGCNIARTSRENNVQLNPRVANLEAQCQLSWYTVQIEPTEPK